MNPIYRVISPISVNAVVEDVYDVITPRSGEIHESRRDGAAAALRSLNPALPGDETPINPESTPYLLLRRIPRTPWRVPPTQSALQHDLAVLGIRNVYALSRVTVAFLRGRLANDYSHEELTRLRNIARLMRIRGVDRDTAAFFHDHDKTPLQTPRQAAEASQSTMRSLLVESGYPNALLSQRPEYWISNYAKILTRRGGRIRTQVRPILLGRREVARDLAFWRARAESPELEAAARQSANTIRWLREIQSDLIRGNIGIARGEGQAAYRYLRRVWSRVGKQAVAEGLIEPNSREANGPSLNTVLEVTWRVLARLLPLRGSGQAAEPA